MNNTSYDSILRTLSAYLDDVRHELASPDAQTKWVLFSRECGVSPHFSVEDGYSMGGAVAAIRFDTEAEARQFIRNYPLRDGCGNILSVLPLPEVLKIEEESLRGSIVTVETAANAWVD